MGQEVESVQARLWDRVELVTSVGQGCIASMYAGQDG